MLTKKRVDNFYRNYFNYFMLGVIARNIWDSPVLDAIVKVGATLFFFLIFLMLYLSWRETHSFRQVCKQNVVNIIAFIIPVTVLLLYVLYKACQ